MNVKTAIHPKDPNSIVTFYESKHLYILKNQERYIDKKLTSGTTFISKFFPKFDADEIAPRVAKKRGVSVAEIKAEWKKNGDEASELGTCVHGMVENYFISKRRTRPKSEKEKIFSAFAYKEIDSLLEEWDIAEIEAIVFNENIAGTLDFLLKHKTKPNTYLLGDWKTNKSLDIINNWGKKALSPISYMHDTNFAKYILQLSLYKYIALKEGFIPEDSTIELRLFHLNKDGCDVYPIDYHEKAIKDLLSYVPSIEVT